VATSVSGFSNKICLPSEFFIPTLLPAENPLLGSLNNLTLFPNSVSTISLVPSLESLSTTITSKEYFVSLLKTASRVFLSISLALYGTVIIDKSYL
jgi:hypothetical protein